MCDFLKFCVLYLVRFFLPVGLLVVLFVTILLIFFQISSLFSILLPSLFVIKCGVRLIRLPLLSYIFSVVCSFSDLSVSLIIFLLQASAVFLVILKFFLIFSSFLMSFLASFLTIFCTCFIASSTSSVHLL